MAATPPAFTLEILEGPLKGKSIASEGSRSFRVGRTKASPIQIKDPSVSEKHAEIRFEDGQWQIRDLGSSNGTSVNGKEVTEDFVNLKNGDLIRFGTDSVAKIEIVVHDSENMTVQQFLEAECERLEQRLRSHAEQLGAGLRNSWMTQKAQLLADL